MTYVEQFSEWVFASWKRIFAMALLLVVLLAAIGIWDTLNRNKWRAFAVELTPQIDKACALFGTFQQDGATFHFVRPYAIVYIGGSKTSSFARYGVGGIIHEQFTTPPTAANIKTLILLRDRDVEHAEYVSNGHRSAYYRYGYDMLPFDIKTGRLGVYSSLNDPPFPSHFTIGTGPDYGPKNLYYSDLCRWADSITDTSAPRELHQK